MRIGRVSDRLCPMGWCADLLCRPHWTYWQMSGYYTVGLLPVASCVAVICSIISFVLD